MNKFSNLKAAALGRSVFYLALCWAMFGTLQAQTRPNDLGGQKYDVFLGASKTVQLDRFVEDVTSSDSNIVRVEKVPGSETQISLTGISLGRGTVTVRSGTGSITYNVHVSPQPQRIYINVPENRRLTFSQDVEEYTVSQNNVIGVRQPDDDVLVIEAIGEGRTALNVSSGGEIYRYFISTFSNRGADRLEIQNSFTKKGYRFLNIEFDRDQAIITGTVPTQEELDDAVRIVKDYTPYVDVRAVVGAVGLDYAESEEERVIINNIKRIAELPNLIVKVKFSQPTEVRRSTFSRVAGSPVLETSVTDNETRLTTNTVELPPADAGSGLLERPIQEGTIEQITRTEDYSVPEKIFLFGQLENDLEEARAIRVARTYCPLIISMVTIKNPIQLRMKVRFVQVDYDKVKNTGVVWSGPGPNGGPLVALNIAGADPLGNLMTIGQSFSQITPPGTPISTSATTRAFTMGLQTNATATLQLTETEGWGRVLDEAELLMINGQPGQLFNGQQIPYTASFAVTENGTVIPEIAFINVGISVSVVPLRLRRASQIAGENIELTSDGQPLIQSLSSYMQLASPVGNQGTAPFIDESTKYVDENGMIGVECFANISTLDPSAGAGANIGFRNIGNGFFAPQTIDSSSSARAFLREGQSVVVSGLLEEDSTRALRKVPYLSEIPILGKLFEAQDNGSNNNELLVVYSPEIVRMSDDDKHRMPEPSMPEMVDYLTQQGDVPILKRVRYDSGEVDLRPDLNRPPYEQPKQISYSKNVEPETVKQMMDLPQDEPKDLDAGDDKNLSMDTTSSSEASTTQTASNNTTSTDSSATSEPGYVPNFRATDSMSGSNSINPRPVNSSTVDSSSTEANTSDAGDSESTLP